MKFFLIIVILSLCAGGYFEYNNLQTEQAADRAMDQRQIANLTSVNTKLKAEAVQLADDASQAQAQIAALTAQLKTVQAAPAVPPTSPTALASNSTPSTLPAPSAPSTPMIQTPAPAAPAPAATSGGDDASPFGSRQPIITTNKAPTAQSPN